jgi:4-hydroxybenzoate polyprenyltransferase
MVAICQLLVAYTFFEPAFYFLEEGVKKLTLLVLATLFSAASGYLINDYYDVKIDVVNKPRRVVVGKVISRRQTMGLHLFFIFLALLFSYPLGKQTFVVVAFCTAWLWLYSNRLKRLPFIGNFSVALLTGLAVFLPDLVFSRASDSLVLFALFAFWISLIREIIKDMEDRKGDERHGCKTLPIVWGLPKTKYFLYLIGLLFLASFGFSALTLPSIWLWLAGFLSIPLGYLFYLLQKADTTRAFASLSLFCKWIMLMGMGSMLLL